MSRPALLTGRHFMHGDHACAEGALAAGCTFFAGYPITPSTEIAERLAVRLPEIGGTFIQMEDELASIAAIIGASAAGVRAMTATSGPGLSLMLENLGLAVMMEVPCVLVDIQRGSPSTGLPTMPGQADIMQARWGSHGDYQAVAYCPWSPQEMFDLTVLSFNMADRYRVPVLVLADEVVGHMVERVIVPAAEEIAYWSRKRPAHSPNGQFEAYRADDLDLVPPLAHAGEGYSVHFTGLTHDERGYPAMSADAHQRLVTRLRDKIRCNAGDIVRFETYHVDDAEVIVIAFGCTARSARKAIRQARGQGIAAGLFRPISLWPFPEDELRRIVSASTSVIVAEMNLGQIALEVERLLHRPVTGIFHAGGSMIAPDPILQKIKEVALERAG
jgi:2-oxoglutarate ferredoxin oxidoreductase subunit alpha